VPVGVDAVLGAEWTGVTASVVQHNAAAPVGNFGTPTSENHQVAYRVYTRNEGAYVYGLFQAAPSLSSPVAASRTDRHAPKKKVEGIAPAFFVTAGTSGQAPL
jgi:hypothetical protein